MPNKEKYQLVAVLREDYLTLKKNSAKRIVNGHPTPLKDYIHLLVEHIKKCKGELGK